MPAARTLFWPACASTRPTACGAFPCHASSRASPYRKPRPARASRSATTRPAIIFSQTPALLVLVDGKPELRQVAGSKLLRVINTPALILFDEAGATYYLRALKQWWSAKAPEGPWAVAANPPSALAAAQKAAGSHVNLIDTPPADIAEAVEAGAVPNLHVSLSPAELIQTAGAPEYLPVPDTELLYVKNTSSHVIVDVANQENYVLIAGRWFHSKSLADGP
ncbi:Carbohydrate-binding family V/XII OS=Bosea thiooxidans OX=53254 GN=SAMN05660750_01322 PE=4 SV=1 [Bosea thiooxidans]